jgi:ethanolamine ammonia-lyase small subunit
MAHEISRMPATTARLSLGDSRPSVATAEHLRFQLDHAQARDAVHASLDVAALRRGLAERGLEALVVQSAARDRRTYLRRPDLGRALDAGSEELLARWRSSRLGARMGAGLGAGLGADPTADHDVVLPGNDESSTPAIAFILADGLSALAVNRHALPLLDATFALLGAGPRLPVCIATQARVALGDAIGESLGAAMTVLLIGERPGLSAADSLGIYITWKPGPGRTDADRNCISNVRQSRPGESGLSYADAARRIVHYIAEAQRLGTTGIALKDPAPVGAAGRLADEVTIPSSPARP